MKITWDIVKKIVEEKKHVYNRIEDNLSKEGIGLYGSGQVGQYMLDYMKENNFKVKCFLDSNKQLHGKKIQEIEINGIESFSGGAILITVNMAVAIDEIKKIIDNAFPAMSYKEWFVIKNLRKYEHIRNNMLADDESKRIFDTIIYEMLTNNDNNFSNVYSQDQYFCLKEFIEGSSESFIDVGAYTGDGIERFIWKNLGNFNKIYAFEPMSKQYKAMEKRVNRLIEEWGIELDKIELIKAAVSDIESNIDVPVREDGISSSTFLYNNINSIKTERVPVNTLDMYFTNKIVTFIKADIEGCEMRMLKGAEKIIKQQKPKLAICVYHKVNDIIEIINYLNRIEPKYKFRIRHHSYNSSETVLYCNI